MSKAVEGSVIVLAEVFNPSIFSQLWLVSEKLLSCEDFAELSIATSQLAQHDLKEMKLLVVPDKLQITFVPSVEMNLKAHNLAKGILKSLPHTPVKALGINFSFDLENLPSNFSETLRHLFCVPDTPLADFFKKSDARFGGYFSQDVDRGRMRLNARPVMVGEKGEEILRFSFNFHFDKEDEGSAESLTPILDSWKEFYEKAHNLVTEIEGTIND